MNAKISSKNVSLEVDKTLKFSKRLGNDVEYPIKKAKDFNRTLRQSLGSMKAVKSDLKVAEHFADQRKNGSVHIHEGMPPLIVGHNSKTTINEDSEENM